MLLILVLGYQGGNKEKEGGVWVQFEWGVLSSNNDICWCVENLKRVCTIICHLTLFGTPSSTHQLDWCCLPTFKSRAGTGMGGGGWVARELDGHCDDHLL